MSKYADIIARLEKAEGADYELDARIAELVGEAPKAPIGGSVIYINKCRWDVIHANGSIERVDGDEYTSSIDASIALVERMLPGWHYTLSNTNAAMDDKRPWCDVASPAWVDDRNEHEFGEASAATLPLAILLAFFLALDAQETQQ